MSQINCSLCNYASEPQECHDLQSSTTHFSKISLFELLRSFMGQEWRVASSTSCKMCFNLLNELDNVQERARIIQDQFKNYLIQQESCNKFRNVSDQNFKINSNELNSSLDKIKTEEPHIEINDTVSSEKKYFANNTKLERNVLNEHNKSLNLVEVNQINFSLEGVVNVPSAVVEDTVEESACEPKKDCSDSKPYLCTECPKAWRSLAELKNHMSSHSNERPFICEVCGQTYKRLQALVVHVGMHKGINPFTCKYCNKAFTQKGALVRHLPIHTGQMPYQCDLCGKRFIHHTSFNIHQVTHTGQKSYKCDLCGILLMSGSHLKRHMRVHTGEKKFSCNLCGKKFAERYNLAVHEKLHAGITRKKKFQCPICDNSYDREIKLAEHLLLVHQQMQNQLATVDT